MNNYEEDIKNRLGTLEKSEECKNVIAQFNRLTSLECTAEEMYAIIKREPYICLKYYDQGVSYAKWGEAKVMVLCDKNQIRVYERDKNG